MSDPHDYPAPHTVVITELADHEPAPVLIPNSVTIDGHEVGHKVAVGGWDVSAGPHGEAILGLRVDAQVVTVQDGCVYVDGHQLCWPAGRGLAYLLSETPNPDTGEYEVAWCLVFAHVASVTIRREPATVAAAA